MIMKKTAFLFFLILSLCINAQTGPTGVYVSDKEQSMILEKPGIRDVVGAQSLM